MAEGRATGKKEIVKAALESIAYQIADVVEMMRAESGLFTGAAKRQFYPRMERRERDARYLGWKDAVNMLQ